VTLATLGTQDEDKQNKQKQNQLRKRKEWTVRIC
jgi:hypothetical protein